ncbi:hypothetical protein [Streptomyces formicae]|uniref:Uncharacterized protein n=1 Tax=Streptomyces formicae TaxID=1616117 RepID=A0ABY3WMG5_9ACTN|nr:hypothetical protein [Streptomyces formicae]UNM13829.1 hypothetical protein J4032_22305 [Streptomyces formicae]
MSTIFPSLPPIPTDPAPAAVSAFKMLHLPKGVAEAELLMDDAVRELRRPRQIEFFGPLLCESDENDRQTAQAMYAQADKTVSSYPERMGSHLRSLS